MHDRIINYMPQNFVYTEVDLKSIRTFVSPIYVTFMLSNKCLTNCVYCYADRYTRSRDLTFDKVESIIKDAARLKLSSFNLDGGDFFLYPYWRQLLGKLQEYNYYPSIISTKYPVSKQDILDFSKFNLNLQISLDSIEQDTLDKIVGHIRNYANRMQQSLKCINDVMPFQIATILTKYNGSIQELESMYTFLSNLDKLKRWEVRVGFKSLYTKKSFEEFQIDRDSISIIEKWVKQKQAISRFEIIWSPGSEIDFFKAKNGSLDFVGGRCSANSIHMFILPDGKVTICEQLYWNKRFLIGDLTKNNISEVWQSDRALYLANMKQKDYSIHSACHNCEIFDKCKTNLNSCYTNILKVYGDEKWDNPDPRCARAPRDISEKIYV
jgi:radical SAM protein with 4Fe4S-binding SPASM domain